MSTDGRSPSERATDSLGRADVATALALRSSSGSVMADKLNRESVQGWIRSHKGWSRKSNTLIKDFQFPSFRDSIVFVNRVATLADTANHHPDIDVRYDSVRVMLTTHDVGGISDKDLELAQQIDFATSAS